MKSKKTHKRFRRLLGKRSYRRLFVIATEGKITEPQYFNIFNNENNTIHVKCLRSSRKSDPKNVLKRVEKYIKENPLINNDEAWLIVDRDRWTEEQLRELFKWSTLKEEFGCFAVSNPLFEYWLLLHFEEGDNVNSATDCIQKLKKYLPDYNKHISENIIMPGIEKAIDRAKQRDNPPCKEWPRGMGTTVYRLVQKLI